MVAVNQVFSTAKLLVQVLSGLSVGDLGRARKVDRTWRTIVDGTPALKRLRCVQPLAAESTVSTDDCEIALPHRRRPHPQFQCFYEMVQKSAMGQNEWERVPRYCPRQPFKLNPNLAPTRGFFSGNFPVTFKVPRNGRERAQLEAIRLAMIFYPPIPLVSLKRWALKGKIVVLEAGSNVMLRVKEGITVGLVLDTCNAMHRSEVSYNNSNGRVSSYDCQALTYFHCAGCLRISSRQLSPFEVEALRETARGLGTANEEVDHGR